MWEIPEPGMPAVLVTPGEELAEILAPLTPALRPTLLGITVMRMPGATLNDLRTLKPMPTPIEPGLRRNQLAEIFDVQGPSPAS